MSAAGKWFWLIVAGSIATVPYNARRPYPGQNQPTVAKGDKLIKKDFLGQAHHSFIAKSTSIREN